MQYDNISARQNSGRFMIAFEGIDGSGKSTQAALLQEHLKRDGRRVSLTREPTDGHIGRLIRNVLSGKSDLNEAALTMLYAADRLDHLERPDGILDKLSKGNIVICDRYFLSSYAYHSDVVDLEWIVALNSIAVRLCVPCLTFYLDVRPEKALARIVGPGVQTERYEYLNKLERVRDAYQSILTSKNIEARFFMINGERDENTIAEEIWQTVIMHLEQATNCSR